MGHTHSLHSSLIRQTGHAVLPLCVHWTMTEGQSQTYPAWLLPPNRGTNKGMCQLWPWSNWNATARIFSLWFHFVLSMPIHYLVHAMSTYHYHHHINKDFSGRFPARFTGIIEGQLQYILTCNSCLEELYVKKTLKITSILKYSSIYLNTAT